MDSIIRESAEDAAKSPSQNDGSKYSYPPSQQGPIIDAVNGVSQATSYPAFFLTKYPQPETLAVRMSTPEEAKDVSYN